MQFTQIVHLVLSKSLGISFYNTTGHSSANMQIPGSTPYETQPSIFEAILQEFSMEQIEVQSSFHQQQICPEEIFKEEKVQQQAKVWFWMDEAPYQCLLSDNQNTLEDINLEFRRVKSLREQQQSKIAQFLRDDKYKSMRSIEVHSKDESPTGKCSQSLSPRKTKKIDKSKPLKLVHQED